MHHPIARQDIREHHPGRVDKHLRAIPADGYILALQRRERDLVGPQQVGAEPHLLRQDVVPQNADQVLSCQAPERRPDGPERIVRRGENGNVGERVDRVHQPRGRQRSGERGKTCVDGCLRGIGWDGKDRVDDVDDAAVKLDILWGQCQKLVSRGQYSDEEGRGY